MKPLILRIAIAAFILLSTMSVAGDMQPLTAQRVEVGPPPWYDTLLDRWSFEGGWTGWQWSGAAQPGFTFPMDGVMNAELCYEQGIISTISQTFSIEGCKEDKPIYFHICKALFTGAGRPPEQDYTDVSQGWLADWQNVSRFQLWEMWDVDDHGQGYECYYVVITGEALRYMHELGDTWTLHGGCDTNEAGAESYTIFILDMLQGFCEKVDAHLVFLPFVANNH